jgi:hypothetical protein
MKMTLATTLAIIVSAAGGLVAFLASWQIPAPSAVVEIVIPNDRFTR